MILKQHNSISPVNREMSQTNRQAGMNDFGMQHNELEHCDASSPAVEYILLCLSARNFEIPPRPKTTTQAYR
jgi:hypothetical protein